MSTQWNPLKWFEIQVTVMARAKAFYEQVFDLTLEMYRMGSLLMAWFPVKESVAGAAGSLLKGNKYQSSLEGVLVYLTAFYINAVLSRLMLCSHAQGRKADRYSPKKPASKSADSSQ